MWKCTVLDAATSSGAARKMIGSNQMNLVKFLEEREIGFEVLPHRETYDAQHMAQALHVSGHHVAKTVLLRADGGFAYIVAVLPATRRVNLERASAALGGSRLELGTEHELSEHCPDCEFGALPPFGSQYDMRTLVDEELTSAERIVFEGNTHHEAIRMRFEDFQQLENPLIAPFAESPASYSSSRD
jgi:Ala-tRNA(Pro) deacylase